MVRAIDQYLSPTTATRQQFETGSPIVTAATLSSPETVDLFKRYVIPNYGRYPINLVRGAGSFVWDSEGKRYLDLFPGW